MFLHSRLIRLASGLTAAGRTAAAGAVTLAVVACCAAPAPAAAQEQPPTQPGGRARPFRGLFGSPQDPSRAQTLTLTGSANAGYDDNVIAGTGGVGADPRAQVGSSIVGGGLGLAYSKSARRVNFNANVNGDTRYYPERSTLSASSYGASAGLSYELSRRSRITLAQATAYQPFYQMGVFPGVGDPVLGGGVPSNLDFAVARRASWITSSNVTFDRQLGRRSSLQLQYAYSNQHFTEDTLDQAGNPTDTGDLTYQMVGFRFTRSLSRYIALRLGYDYRRGTFSQPADTVTEGHNIDVGIDYARTLSFSRRTRLSFSTGSAIVQTSDQDRRYRVTGNATLSHEITRDWNTSLTYVRDVGFFGNFNQPIFSDSVSARLRGVLADRLLMTVTAGFLTGDLGLTDDGSTSFKTFTGSASLLYGLTQLLGVDVTYSYFDYRFSDLTSPTDPNLPPGLPPSFGRNSIRAGLTLWLPLLR
jgi:hypothetical protein